MAPEQAQHSAFRKAHHGNIIRLHSSTHDRYELLIVVTPAEAHVAQSCCLKEAPVMIAEKHKVSFFFLLAEAHFTGTVTSTRALTSESHPV